MSRNFELMQQAVPDFEAKSIAQPNRVSPKLEERGHRNGTSFDFGQVAREQTLRLAQRTSLLCIAQRGPARGRNARVDPRDPATSRRTATAETAARDCRSRLRQRSSARAVGGTRHRIGRATSMESQQTTHPRWPGAAPVQASLEGGTHHFMARQLSPPGRSLRPLGHHLRSFL
jgi:hypothetical protein